MKNLETIVTMGTYDTHKNQNKKHITTQRTKMGMNPTAGEPTMHRNYTFNILTVTI